MLSAAAIPSLGRAGIACLILSLAVGEGFTLERQRQGREAASRLLAVFTPGDEITATQAAAEAEAQRELVASRPYVRRDFLQTALQRSTDARRLRSREQGFLVSLSQMKSSEARSLYQSVVLPAVTSSTDPEVLHEGFALMAGWSIADTLDTREKEKLASNLVAAILRSQNLRADEADQIDALASGLAILAPGVHPAAAGELAHQIAPRLMTEENFAASSQLLAAWRSVAPSVEQPAPLASLLLQRMSLPAGRAASQACGGRAGDAQGKPR